MRVKTSITLSEQALAAVDEMVGEDGNRSRVIEAAILEFARVARRREPDEQERAKIDAVACELNREAADVLEYQTEL